MLKYLIGLEKCFVNSEVVQTMTKITVHSPATIANVVCGFDCIGFAINEPFDEISVRLTDEGKIKIRHFDNFNLPVDADKNVAGKSLLAMMKKLEFQCGFEIEIKKGIKPGSGIGSSAASAVGAVVAANEILGRPFDDEQLLEFALEGEAVASQSRHADNLAPCLFGGFVLIRSTEPLDIVKLDFPPLFVTVIHPQIEVKTSEARRILPQMISLKNAVTAWANVGALVAALEKGDYELLARCLKDEIIEPVRKRLIPHFDELKEAGLKAGAIGGGISGSGPSVFMLSDRKETAEKIALEMAAVLSQTEIPFKTYVSEINSEGVKIFRES